MSIRMPPRDNSPTRFAKNAIPGVKTRPPFTSAIRRMTGWFDPPALFPTPAPSVQALATIAVAARNAISTGRGRVFIHSIVSLPSPRVDGRLGAGGAGAHCGKPQVGPVASTNVGPRPLWMPSRPGATITGVAPIPAQRAKLARLSAAPIGLAVALGALAVARGPGRFTTYAGRSGLAAALTLAAGLALVLAGLITCLTRRAGRVGDLALLAGFAWFAPVWVGWQVGSPLVRSLGMLTAGFAFPLLFHLVLASPSGELRSTVTRALVWAVYLEAVLAALGLALFRDPYFDPACWANCTDNVFLLRSLPVLARGIEVTDRWFTAAAAAALMTVCAWRIVKQPHPSRAALLPTSLPAILFAAATIAHAIALYRVPLE